MINGEIIDMQYEEIINKKSFNDSLRYLNEQIKIGLEKERFPIKIIGNIFYPHTPGFFYNEPLYWEMEKKRERYSLALQNKSDMFEIGINGGHSSLLALESNPNLKVVANDIAKFYPPCRDRHPEIYVQIACKTLKEIYGDRFSYIIGDCQATVPKFINENKDRKFDVIHLDGAKQTYTKDFYNLYDNMTDDCTVIFDDMQDNNVKQQISNLFKDGKIKENDLFPRMKENRYTHEIVTKN